MGMLHTKIWVNNVKAGIDLGMGVVMTAWVVRTRVYTGVQKAVMTTPRPKLTLDSTLPTSITYVLTCNMPILDKIIF